MLYNEFRFKYLYYICFFSTADVIEVEALDAEALLRLVEAPQPLALRRPSLALPPLAAAEI